MKQRLFFFTFFSGAAIVFYFSWKLNPDLEAGWLIPEWLANWGNENFNLRTAVPFVFMGLVIGWLMVRSFRFYVICWLVMVLLVLIAEGGQLLMPSRQFDFWDIAFGATGAALGLGMGKCMSLITQKRD